MSHYGNDVPFEIPEGWVWCRLKDITELIEDCPHSTAPDEGKGYPLIRTSNVGEGHLILKGVHRVSQKVYENRTIRAIPKYGDIIYAREAPAGNAAVIAENEIVCLGQRTVLIRPLGEYVDPMLLTYFMLSPYSKNTLISRATGSTVQHVNMEMIRPLYVPVPPHNEQIRITAEIKHYFNIIDQIEQGLVTLNSTIIKAKSKILGLALSGKLTSDTSHYPQLPDGWEYKQLDEVLDYEQPQKYIVESTDYSDDYTMPVLTAGKSFIIGHTNERTGICTDVPVIIFDDFTTDSKFVNFPFKVKSSAMKILHPKVNINLKYIAYFMSTTRLVGTTHKRYWISEYSKIKVPVPPKEEQDKIVFLIEKFYSLMDSIFVDQS